MPPKQTKKKTITAKAFRDFLEGDEWVTNPDTLYENIVAIKRQRSKLLRPTAKQEINELLDRAAGLLEILKESGNPVPSHLSPSNSNSATRKAKKVPLSNSSNDEMLAVLASPVVPLRTLVRVKPAAAPVVAAKASVSAAKPAAAPVVAAKASVSATKPSAPPAKPSAAKASAAKANSPTTLAARNIVIPFHAPKVSPASCSKLTPAFIEEWMAGIAGSLAVEIARHRRDPPRHTRNENIHPAFNRDFVIKQTEGDGTCLIHAFLTDLSPIYRSLPRTVQRLAGQAFRRKVYAFLHPTDTEMKLEKEDYDTFALPEPSTHARIVKVDGNSERRANTRAYIQNTNGYLYDKDVEHLQECFGTRIILVTKSAVAHDKIRLMGDVSPDDLAREYEIERSANIPADKYTKYIMIFVRPGHYEGVRHRAHDRYIFGYPEVRDVIQAAVHQEAAVDLGIKARFTPGTIVTLNDGRVAAVHEDGVRGWFLPFDRDDTYVPIGVYVDVGAAAPYLADLTEIVAIGEDPFDSVPYLVERFEPGVPVRLVNGTYREVHRKGLQMAGDRPAGLWLKKGAGSELYSLDSVAFFGSTPAKGHKPAVLGEPFRIGQFRMNNSASASASSSNSNSPALRTKKQATRRLVRVSGKN